MYKKRMSVLLIVAWSLCWPLALAQGQGLSLKDQPGETNPIKISVIVDNYAATSESKTDWGFSCLIEGTENTILFDTGASPDVWLHNVARMQIDLSKVQQVVISHDHSDHTGGLPAALARNHNVTVCLLSAFSNALLNSVQDAGARVVTGDQPRELCRNVFVSGESGTQIKEQALVINSRKGLVVITGCAHPGIVNMLKRIKGQFARDMYLVLGGFHLLQTPDSQVRDIIGQFRVLGVARCGATHCTGDKAIALFKEAYGPSYVELGAGRVLQITEAGLK